MIEYVSLGDFQTAVGFLLASTPEKSIRYYRDALCTLALAVSPLSHENALGAVPEAGNFKSQQAVDCRMQTFSFASSMASNVLCNQERCSGYLERVRAKM